MGSQAEKRHAWLVRRPFPVWLKAVLKEKFPIFFSNGSLVRTRPEFAKITTLKKWLFLDAHTLVCLRNHRVLVIIITSHTHPSPRLEPLETSLHLPSPSLLKHKVLNILIPSLCLWNSPFPFQSP